MAVLMKPATAKSKKKVIARGRKMAKGEARDFVFKTYASAMLMLAKQ